MILGWHILAIASFDLDYYTQFKCLTAYDELDRLTKTIDAEEQTTELEYDDNGNLIELLDAEGRIVKSVYDSHDRLTEIIDPLNNSTFYEYDADDNLITTIDPLGNKTNHVYDARDRLTRTIDAEDNPTNYLYDAADNLVEVRDGNNHPTRFRYDDLTTEIWLDDNNNPIHTIDSNYDAASQLLDISDPHSAYSYDYDKKGRVTEVDNLGTPDVPNVVFNLTHDPVDNLTQVNDSIDGIEAGVETFTYDELDRVTKITQSGNEVVDKRVDYSYDPASQIKEITRYSDLEGSQEIANSSYTFDKAGRLTNLTHDQEGNVLSAYEWAYDQGDRITQAISPDGVSSYDYDKTDQLVDAEYDFQSDESYLYDQNGNRANDGYVTGENNQLLSDGTFNYEYDNEGNRVKKIAIATGEVTDYQWDYRNRLGSVEKRDSEGNVVVDADYTYDVFDRRIAKSVEANGEVVEERFVYDSDHLALTFDGDGNQTERFLHGLQIDEVLAQENVGGELLWALPDNQGSVKMLLDNQGNVVNEITYDAFGNITVESNPDVNFRFTYTGRELDPETGNYFYRTRFLDPFTHFFISQDTIGFAGGDANLYRYVVNSPVNYIDPYGYRTETRSGQPNLLTPGSAGAGGSGGGGRVPTGGGLGAGGRLGVPTGNGLNNGNIPYRPPYNPQIPPTNPTQLPSQFVPPVSNPNQLPSDNPQQDGDSDNSRSWRDALRDWWNENNPFNDDDNEAENDRQQDNERNQDNQPEPEIRACDANLGDPPRNNDDDDDEDEEYLYRGDTRPPSEIFEEGGFWPRNPNGNISLREHVTQIRDNPREDLSDILVDIDTESQWVSTSNNEQHAAIYSEIVNSDTRKVEDYGYLYRIRRPPGGRNVFEEVGDGTPNRTEISFEGGFDRQHIDSYRKVLNKNRNRYDLGPSIPFPR